MIKIILTNGINLLGVFLSVLVVSVFLALVDRNLSYNLLQAILASLFLVLGYGIMFWAAFIVSLIVLDLTLVIPNQRNLKTKLLIEWLIISSAFIYWTIEYREWIFVAAIIAFFISQQLRGRHLETGYGKLF